MTSSRLTSLVKFKNAAFDVSLLRRQAIAALRTSAVICMPLQVVSCGRWETRNETQSPARQIGLLSMEISLIFVDLAMLLMSSKLKQNKNNGYCAICGRTATYVCKSLLLRNNFCKFGVSPNARSLLIRFLRKFNSSNDFNACKSLTPMFRI